MCSVQDPVISRLASSVYCVNCTIISTVRRYELCSSATSAASQLPMRHLEQRSLILHGTLFLLFNSARAMGMYLSVRIPSHGLLAHTITEGIATFSQLPYRFVVQALYRVHRPPFNYRQFPTEGLDSAAYDFRPHGRARLSAVHG